MSERPTDQAATPARKNHARQAARSVGQKAYASENDVAAMETSRRRNTPRTPSKANNVSAVHSEFYASQTSSNRSRTKAKSRPVNLPTSPDSAPAGRQTPQRSVSSKPGVNAAFAGATFHASPAPSSLPIPSFLSKSSSESPIALGRGVTQEPSPPTTDRDGDAMTPFRPSSVPRINESPLDFMFRAHREEKERHFYSVQKPVSTFNDSPQRFASSEMRSSLKPASLPNSRRTYLKEQIGGIDASELDGTPGRPMGPAFSTPYNERIKAARSGSGFNPQCESLQSDAPSEGSQTKDPTDALKKFLFGNIGLSSSDSVAPATASKAASHPMTVSDDKTQDSSRIEARESGPDNIEAMENDLRRILKLDIASAPAHENRAFLSR